MNNATQAATTAAKQILEPGEYFGSAHGQYNGKHIQELAIKLGWTGELIADPYEEDYIESWIEAEQYIDMHHTPDGYWFGSTENGDIGIWENDAEDECDGCHSTGDNCWCYTEEDSDQD